MKCVLARPWQVSGATYCRRENRQQPTPSASTDCGRICLKMAEDWGELVWTMVTLPRNARVLAILIASGSPDRRGWPRKCWEISRGQPYITSLHMKEANSGRGNGGQTDGRTPRRTGRNFQIFNRGRLNASLVPYHAHTRARRQQRVRRRGSQDENGVRKGKEPKKGEAQGAGAT